MHSQNIQRKNKLHEGQLFKISRFKEVIKTTQPHTHEGYHEFIYLQAGEGFHWVETDSYRINAPEFYFLKPGQLHCWQFTSIPKGYVILFREEYFDVLREGALRALLQGTSKTVRLTLPEAYQPAYLFEEIIREHSAGASYSTQIIHGCLQVIFSKFLQLAEIREQASEQAPSLFERFARLLPERCPELHLVNEFAVLLHTTPQNLNAACRKHAAKSASGLIAAQLLLGAKRHLFHTDKTVAEIAHQLNFSDASYFVRFFKKHEGVTPGQFRERRF